MQNLFLIKYEPFLLFFLSFKILCQTQCLESSSFCKPVWYEQLVLHPEATIKEITDFLGIDFSMSISRVWKNVSVYTYLLNLNLTLEWSLKAFSGHKYFRVTSGHRCQNSEIHEKKLYFSCSKGSTKTRGIKRIRIFAI